MQPRVLTETSSARGSLSQPTIAHLLEGFGITDARGLITPRSTDPPSRPPTVQLGRDIQPRDLVHGRKGVTIPFPEKPWTLEQPRLPPRVESRPLRGCLCLPAMVLPESYNVGPAFARAYYMGNDNKMHCLLPCSNEPFCPFHSACGRLMNPGSLEHADDHKGHLCSRCKEFLDKSRNPRSHYKIEAEACEYPPVVAPSMSTVRLFCK